MDVLAVEQRTQELVEYVRNERVPAFLEARTYRFRAHSMYDPQLYRGKSEVKEWENRGPIITLTQRLKAENLMSEEDFVRLQRAANDEVDEAVSFAERGSLESVDELTRFVYAEPTA
jgi:TPP-dependent pyruvate/acetoin dehydrogenase alpha subunit